MRQEDQNKNRSDLSKINLPSLSDGNAYIAIARGSRDDFNIEAYIAVRYLGGFYPSKGWELKDCQVKGLPDRYRYEVLRDYWRVENQYGQEAFIFLI